MEDSHFKMILNKADLRATDERLAVLKILSALKKPATLKEINKKIKGIHEVTLYRILASFKEVGLVRQVYFGDVVPYFEILDHKHDHHHIVCTKCKKVSDFVGCQVDSLIKKALNQTKDFNKVTAHSFELFGLCNTCTK